MCIKSQQTLIKLLSSTVTAMMKVLLLAVLSIAAVSAKPFFTRHPGLRITGGEDAAEGQFPYQISYQWGILGFFEHVCGGSIISPTWIVTAGHCVTEVPAIGEYKIVAGITNLFENNAQRQEINVVEKIVHSDYAGGVAPNDIALLRLQSPLEFGDLVQPINLPAADLVASGDSVLSGWGSTSTSQLPIMPAQLQTTTIPVLANSECVSAIDAVLEQGETNPFSDASNICTGPLTGGISACSGDSGGPLAQENTLIGIVSWGMTPCGSEGAPSVYTKVSNFIDFIIEHVADLPK
ncbi:Trypsin domain containing protein [Asbolus verrucosus]|uniref:Trypsin domain containing protein n=1 Tax=Asbolus verrucosus TaxID=1661398 RepID=A0A482V2H8_ASBVE|nr:Trypsin domain containing protein [Asbolus verrucosus]